MVVRDLLRMKGSDVISVEPGTDLDAVVHLLMRHRIGGLPVVGADGTPLGFVAERDVVRAVDRNPEGIRHLAVDAVMQAPAPTCTGDDSLRRVMGRMTRERLRHLIVVDGGRIAGVISVGDLVKHRLEQLETEAGVLRDYVAAQRAAR